MSELARDAVLMDMTRAAVVQRVQQILEPARKAAFTRPTPTPPRPEPTGTPLADVLDDDGDDDASARPFQVATGISIVPVAKPTLAPSHQGEPEPPTQPEPAALHGATPARRPIPTVLYQGSLGLLERSPGPERSRAHDRSPAAPDRGRGLDSGAVHRRRSVRASDTVAASLGINPWRAAARRASAIWPPPCATPPRSRGSTPTPTPSSNGWSRSPSRKAILRRSTCCCCGPCTPARGTTERWEQLRDPGAYDYALRVELGDCWRGEPGHFGADGAYQTKGGSKPAIWLGDDARQAPRRQAHAAGAALLKRVRDVLEIPPLKGGRA